jgi:hypothetical protein
MRVSKPVPPRINPSDALREGVAILETVLVPIGFHFSFGGEGKGSGGMFALGEFVRGDRRLEIHFRYNLGLVRYHVGTVNASHDFYMAELGVREKCKYPGYSDDFRDAFRDLTHDLGFADDFLTGTGAVLKQAGIKESKAAKPWPPLGSVKKSK